jgi:hypothetical protein
MATAKTSKVTAKQILERAIGNLPEDATIDEAVDALYVALKVGKGKAEIDEGKGMSQEEVEESLEKWLA